VKEEFWRRVERGRNITPLETVEPKSGSSLKKWGEGTL